MPETILPLSYYIFLAFLSGLVIGSFLNVVISRVPAGKSVMFPGSNCPACGQRIRWLDNIPVISFLLLRGRCRKCGERISAVYPVVEMLTAVLFTAIVFITGPGWEAVLEMIFTASMIALVFIDWQHKLLPDRITYPLLLFALVATSVRAGWGRPINYSFDLSLIFSSPDTQFPVVFAAITGGLLFVISIPMFLLAEKIDLLFFNKYIEWEEMNEESPTDEDPAENERKHKQTVIFNLTLGLFLGFIWTILMFTLGPSLEDAWYGLIRAFAGGLIAAGAIWFIRALYYYVRGFVGMGMGDIKLIASIGAFLGWQGAFSSLLAGSIAAAIIGAVLAMRSKRGLKTELPFGVFLGAASIFVMVWLRI